MVIKVWLLMAFILQPGEYKVHLPIMLVRATGSKKERKKGGARGLNLILHENSKHIGQGIHASQSTFIVIYIYISFKTFYRTLLHGLPLKTWRNYMKRAMI